MVQKTLLLFVTVFFSSFLSAQTNEEKVAQLKAEKEKAVSQIKALKNRADSLQKRMDEFPGWKFGIGGTLGLDFRSFNNWLNTANPNGFASTFAFTGSGYANLDKEKFFWRNGTNLNIARTKLAITEAERDTATYQTSADAINLSSLFGYKLSKQFAVSSLMEYRSTIANNFNNPGYLDAGVGMSWKPITDFVLVIHPLNYNFVFSDTDFNYQSSLGAKLVADYARKLPRGIGWKSHFSAFLSYENMSNLSNWTWINGFTTSVKGIGVGLDLGLRKNKQEALAFEQASNPDATFDNLDNPLQTYWVIGLSYSF